MMHFHPLSLSRVQNAIRKTNAFIRTPEKDIQSISKVNSLHLNPNLKPIHVQFTCSHDCVCDTFVCDVRGWLLLWKSFFCCFVLKMKTQKRRRNIITDELSWQWRDGFVTLNRKYWLKYCWNQCSVIPWCRPHFVLVLVVDNVAVLNVSVYKMVHRFSVVSFEKLKNQVIRLFRVEWEKNANSGIELITKQTNLLANLYYQLRVKSKDRTK